MFGSAPPQSGQKAVVTELIFSEAASLVCAETTSIITTHQANNILVNHSSI